MLNLKPFIPGLILILFVVLVTAVYMNSYTIRNRGTLNTVNVAAYQDSQCIINLTVLDWGTIIAGDNLTRSGYLRNEGNINIKLKMTYGNWTLPYAANFLSLGWDCENWTLVPNQAAHANFTLYSIYAPYPAINFTSFAFDITVTGTETPQ